MSKKLILFGTTGMVLLVLTVLICTGIGSVALPIRDIAGILIHTSRERSAPPARNLTMPPYVPGTINIMLWLNGRMTSGAMVNAVQTAVEAKAAALADAGVLDSENGLPATGTTTDAIVIAVGQAVEVEEPQPMITYSGTATTAGAAIGRLVYDTVTESLRAGLLWKERVRNK